MVFTSFFNPSGRRQALTEGPAAPLAALAHRRPAAGPAQRALPLLRTSPSA